MTVEVGPSGGQGLLRDPGNGFLANFIQRPLERWRRADGRDLIEDSILQAFSGIQRRHYFAIFVLASVTLAYQILITRFFSVMLYYHFAFAAISLAMFGLTRGAIEVYNKPSRYAPERVAVEFARHASFFAITSVGAMIVFLCVPLVLPSEYVRAALAVVTIAFV